MVFQRYQDPVELNVWLTPCDVSGLDAVVRVLGEEPRLGLLGEELDDTPPEASGLNDREVEGRRGL